MNMNRTSNETTRTRKSIRRRIWWSDHFLEAIMAVLFAGFLTSYSIDRSNNREDHTAIYKEINATNENMIKYDIKLRTVSLILIRDPNTDPELKTLLIDYIKLETRGGS